MSTTTAADYTLPLIGGRNHFLIRRLHSLSGILFGGYVIIHLLVNASLVQGGQGARDIYQIQVDKIHSLPFLWAIEWAFIYLPILFHAVYGTYITFTGQPNVTNYPFLKNTFYLVQRVTAVALLFFIAFHVLGMKGLFGAHSSLTFDESKATLSTVHHIRSNWLVAYFVYPLFVLTACFHLANGFWTAAITWGLTVSAAAHKRWGVACIALFAFTTLCGFLALIAVWSHKLS